MLNPLIYSNKDKKPIKEKVLEYLTQLFCDHYWIADTRYGVDPWLVVFIKIRAKCKRCGKIKELNSRWINEYPDNLLDKSIYYG